MKPIRAFLPSLLLVVLFGASIFSPLARGTDNRELFGDLWTKGIGGRGSATIDGFMHQKEWRHAQAVDFVANTPGGTPQDKTRATLYVMNDRKNLYIGLKFKRAALDLGNSLVVSLDANGTTWLDVGDDEYGVSGSGFFDTARAPCPGGGGNCSYLDWNLGGTSDGEGALTNDGSYTTYELAHPLNSGDPYDVALHRGDSIGFRISLRMIGPGSAIADTDWPFAAMPPIGSPLWGVIRIQ